MKMKNIIIITILAASICIYPINLASMVILKESELSRHETPVSSFTIAWGPNGTAISNLNDDQNLDDVCSDGVGGAIIAWSDERNGVDYNIYAQRINPNGITQWGSNGTAICTESNDQVGSQICSDGTEGAIIVWTDERSGGNYDIYAQRVDSIGNKKWVPNGVAICTASGDQYLSGVCSDGAGGIIIVWEDRRYSSQNDIFIQRIDFNGNILWDPNGTAICTVNDYQSVVVICSDESGGAFISWKDSRSGVDHLYAQRIDSDGIIQWTPNGSAICTENAGYTHLDMCTDGIGGVFITWRDARGDNVYAQRIDVNGNYLWKANGTAICTEINTQIPIQIYSNGIDGVIILWEDYRSGLVESDIYAQKLDINGNFLWEPNGTAICTANGDQYGLLINDGNGGVIIIWEDNRKALDYDIYAQRVDSNGNIKWAPNGTAICTAINDQVTPMPVSDGAGGAIFAWYNYRNDCDVYAQRIKNDIPISDHPESIKISLGDLKSINWTLFDDYGGGKYRVLINNNHVWVNWTSWINNTQINIQINSNEAGIFNYTIEFFDDQNQYGIPDTVVVTIESQIIGSAPFPIEILIIGGTIAGGIAIGIIITLLFQKRRK